jgi:hypothetical protein
MGHLHTKMMNRLQAALLEHDFVIQYKKGAIMPADYLSRLPSTNEHQLAEITPCFDPFQPEVPDLQKADSDLQKMHSSKISKTKKLKLWLNPFFQNGFVNSASQRKFTLTVGKS